MLLECGECRSIDRLLETTDSGQMGNLREMQQTTPIQSLLGEK